MLDERVTVGRVPVVAHYRWGYTVRGFVEDFHPRRRSFYMVPTRGRTAYTRVLVKLSDLKALFFVKDLNTTRGTGANIPCRELKPQSSARCVVVKFKDGEILVGGTNAYSPDAPGFFLFPLDTTTNNGRVFVVRSAAQVIHALVPGENLCRVIEELERRPAVSAGNRHAGRRA